MSKASHPLSGEGEFLGRDLEDLLAKAMGADDNLEQLAQLIRHQAETIEEQRRDLATLEDMRTRWNGLVTERDEARRTADSFHGYLALLAEITGKAFANASGPLNPFFCDIPEMVESIVSDRDDTGKALATARDALAFFRSVIQSGERWSDQCERAYNEARGT